MNKLDYIFFIGKCLSLEHCKENILKVKELLLSGHLNYEQLIWYASDQLVLPAFYLNLKRAKLLEHLPNNLISYLNEITQLNRVRNIQIIKQAKQISRLLSQIGINPIFLKGTAHLLQGLYKDVGERMIGDIDILVSDHHCLEIAKALMANGYKTLDDKAFIINTKSRHCPRLVHPEYIAGVEIHWRIAQNPYGRSMPFSQLEVRKVSLDSNFSASVLSTQDQLLNNMILVQFNDGCFYNGNILLRQMYDLHLLSEHRDPLLALKRLGNYFKRLNAYLYTSYHVLGQPSHISYDNSITAQLFFKYLIFVSNHILFYRILIIIPYVIYRVFNSILQIIQSTYNPAMRKSIISRLSNPKWYKKHLQSYLTMK